MFTVETQAIEEYLRANNVRDTAAMALCFAPDATVHDEGVDHRGIDAIKEWIAGTTKSYQATITPTAIQERGGEIVATCQVSGNFPGSPIELPFHFTLEGGKIANLNIGG